MKKILYACLLMVFACSCGRPSSFVRSGEWPDIFPDYVGVTVPENCPELRFRMADGRKCSVHRERRGDTVFVTVRAWDKGRTGVEFREFPIYISHDPIDPYVAYRLIEPGYESWNHISLSIRELSSFKESVMVDNKANGQGCLNCHSFADGNPEKMMFHARGKGGGTVFVDGDKVRKLNLAEIGPKKQGVYPIWNPDGRYIAFSSNLINQGFTIDHPQPIEVYDLRSDIILFDTATDSVCAPPVLCSEEMLETFPGWSPDGKTLYYCAAKTPDKLPKDRESLHYALMAIGFEDGQIVGEPRRVFGSDTLSVSFPRAFGDYILFTASSFATFPIWHKEADLWLLDTRTGEAAPATALNSPDTESYHSWSSNGRWVVFSSRRIDGRYTRLFIAHFDPESGVFSKPYLLPQKNPDLNTLRLYSYNIPEFVRGKVENRNRQVSKLFDL